MGVGEVEKGLKYFFNEWELGICMLLSLFLQIWLILAGPLRRTVSRKWLDIPLWLAYLLADGTAVFAVGLISSKEIYYTSRNLNAPPNNILHTFWAPFLLVHLGGPDPITAFALEDNELWLRHLFNFFTQCIVVAYVFYQSLTPNKLLAPSLLIYLCGIIKYAERTYALYCASANTFRDSILREPDPDSANFMRKYISERDAKFPVRTEMLPEPDGVIEAVTRMEASEALDLKPLEVIQYAFRYFTLFKGLVVDLIFSLNQRNQSREFFLKRSSNDAFRVVEVELNFLYDVLFTKVPVVYYRIGFGCRAVSVGAIVTSLMLFLYAEKKHFKPQGFEVGITYTLLIGGIVLEVIAFFMLVFSDWTVVNLEPSPDEILNEQSWKRIFLDFIVSANFRRGKIICWLLNIGAGKDYQSKPNDGRWAETISGYNFIDYCLHRRSEAKEKIYDRFGITAFLDGMVYVRQHPLPSYVKEFIFEELKIKSLMAADLDTVRKISSAKGELVLQIAGYSGSEFFSYVADVDYDESLLLWHIATELCYNNREDEIILGHLAEPPKHHRRIAKLISDYMIYLLVMKPGMMSAVSRIGLIRFRLTCAAATKFFDRAALMRSTSMMTVSQEFIHSHMQITPALLEKDRNKSILYEAARLARELKKIKFIERWEIMSKVWVELLSYGACHIKTNAHAQQLSKGGELITVVWLLMTHLGLGDHFHQVGVGKPEKPERLSNNKDFPADLIRQWARDSTISKDFTASVGSRFHTY